MPTRPPRHMVKVSLNMPAAQIAAADELVGEGILPFASRSAAVSYIYSLGYDRYIQAKQQHATTPNPLIPEFIPVEKK